MIHGADTEQGSWAPVKRGRCERNLPLKCDVCMHFRLCGKEREHIYN